MVHANKIFARQTEPFCTLCPRSDENSLKSKGEQIFKLQIALCANSNIAIIINVGVFQYLAELLAESLLHCMLDRVNPILGQPSRFDITIENDYSRSVLGKFTSAKKAGRAGTNYCYEICVLCCHESSLILSRE